VRVLAGIEWRGGPYAQEVSSPTSSSTATSPRAPLRSWPAERGCSSCSPLASAPGGVCLSPVTPPATKSH
jgi:hypothetical protein